MPSLSLARVSFAHSDDVPIFTELDLRLEPDWTGVVGANGAGKTTLLRLLIGDLQPESGGVWREPADLTGILCPQTIGELDDAVRSLAESCAGAARRLLGVLHLRPQQLERWPTLSPGERKRWQVGAALAREPALLLLDEPTNHLDAEARAWLGQALAGYRGIGVLVSHDRALLDTLTSHTLRIDAGRVRLWKGGYEKARDSWQAEARGERKRLETLRGEQRKLERRISDRRRERARAESRMRTSKRMKSHKDSDARLRFKAKRRRSAEVSLGREIHKAHHKLDEVASEASSIRLERELGRALFVDWVPARVPRLLELRTAELCAGESRLLEDVDVAVERASRIRVAGPNGAGKTTLLRRLVDGARFPTDRLVYLPQELEAGESLARLEELRSLPPDDRGRTLGFVAALGVDPDRLLRTRRPSPGEARKLALALGLGRQVWVLVLDEPTNHLDLPSIERLEACLVGYPGALLLVTHDESLARAATPTTWRLQAGRIEIESTGTGTD